jgi:glucose-6-phosphate dehydrogenase assembly protein OpcA
MLTADGDLSIERSDGITAELHLPGSADSQVALPRRDLAELLTEELRRLDPDEVYQATLMGCT